MSMPSNSDAPGLVGRPAWCNGAQASAVPPTAWLAAELSERQRLKYGVDAGNGRIGSEPIAREHANTAPSQAIMHLLQLHSNIGLRHDRLVSFLFICQHERDAECKRPAGLDLSLMI